MTRAVSLLLLLALIVSVFPLSVLAGAVSAEETKETATVETEPSTETKEQETDVPEETNDHLHGFRLGNVAGHL